MSRPVSTPPDRAGKHRVGRVHVLLHVAAGGDGPGPIEEAYHAVSQTLDGTPGLLGNALLRSLTQPGSFVVMSEWSDLAAFRAWEEGAGHRGATAPLRPFQNRDGDGVFGVYEVAASY